jgi:beta-xylosidase
VKKLVILSLLFITWRLQCEAQYVPDNGNGTYTNPIIYADYSDPDVCRVGDDFYMTASSFNAIPGLPILHSKDLVNWTIINHALQPNVDPHFDIPQHGNGVWAPSIRHQNGEFYIFWGDPDRGIYMVKTRDPKGEWSAPVLVKKAYGNIDPCPLWDDDGKVYMVHAFAHSRVGINSTLQVVELSADADEVITKGKIVVDGHETQPTLEGPKFYKRNGYNYIFAPAGGVPTGWQTVFRSRNVYGPYEERLVLAQGNTDINGPHQGGWVELENEEHWFVHFQDLEAYGRVVHLQPMRWLNDWPIMGENVNQKGVGEPVRTHKKPTVKEAQSMHIPQTSDDLDTDLLGLQWQWNANPRPHWYSLTKTPGHLTLSAVPQAERHNNLWMVPNILTQKIAAPNVSFEVKMDVSALKEKEEAGVLIFGLDYAGISLQKAGEQLIISQPVCVQADKGSFPEIAEKITLQAVNDIWLKTTIKEGKASWMYSLNGTDYTAIGSTFSLREGKWVGAKVALYCTRTQPTGMPGFVNLDWVKISTVE